jgi:hypothetical protein
VNLKIYDSGDSGNGFDRYVILLMNRPGQYSGLPNCPDAYEAILCGDEPNKWITGDVLYDREELGTLIEFEKLPKWVQERLQEIEIYI